MEKDEVERFEYKTIWEGINQRSRDVWPMGGFLIGTALLSMAYTAVNLRTMQLLAVLVLAIISMTISVAWLIVFVRINQLNDRCFEQLRHMEKMSGKYVGIAQSLMYNWAKDILFSRYATRRAFYIVVVALILAWIALICIKLFNPS